MNVDIWIVLIVVTIYFLSWSLLLDNPLYQKFWDSMMMLDLIKSFNKLLHISKNNVE